MATQKQINANQMMEVFIQMIHAIKIHRGSNNDTLSKFQHRLLDTTIEDGAKLIQIAMNMPPKKEIGNSASEILNDMKYNMMDILPVREMNPMNALYGAYLVFISVAKDVLDKYLH